MKVRTLKVFKWNRNKWPVGSILIFKPRDRLFKARLMDGVVALKIDPVEGEDYETL